MHSNSLKLFKHSPLIFNALQYLKVVTRAHALQQLSAKSRLYTITTDLRAVCLQFIVLFTIANRHLNRFYEISYKKSTFFTNPRKGERTYYACYYFFVIKVRLSLLSFNSVGCNSHAECARVSRAVDSACAQTLN